MAVSLPPIERREGRTLFGADPAAYDRARPGHPDRVYDVLGDRCELGLGTAVLEVGPGTGHATRRLLELGADPLVAVEPDPSLADYLLSVTENRPAILRTPLEDVDVPDAAFDLAAAASSFHWVDEDVGLAKIASALKPGAWWAMWWTLFGEGSKPDAFMTAIDPLLEDLHASPSRGERGRPAHALDSDARLRALEAAGFEGLAHEIVRWEASWDTGGIRELYGTFSPIARLDEARKEEVLDGVARVAERDFGGRVERTLTTSLYTACRPV